MATRYRVREGYAVKVEEDAVVEGGGTIDLEEDDAHLRDHRLELVETAPPAKKDAKA